TGVIGVGIFWISARRFSAYCSFVLFTSSSRVEPRSPLLFHVAISVRLAQKFDGREVTDHRFSNDLVKSYKCIVPVTGITGILPVVSQHEVAVLRNCVGTVVSCGRFRYEAVVQRL